MPHSTLDLGPIVDSFAAPRVTVAPCNLVGVVRVIVEADHDHDARGGELRLPLDALRQLPASLARALERFDADAERAA